MASILDKPEKLGPLLEAIAAGASYNAACKAVGISYRTMARKQRDDPAFAAAVSAASAKAEQIAALKRAEEGQLTLSNGSVVRTEVIDGGRRVRKTAYTPPEPKVEEVVTVADTATAVAAELTGVDVDLMLDAHDGIEEHDPRKPPPGTPPINALNLIHLLWKCAHDEGEHSTIRATAMSKLTKIMLEAPRRGQDIRLQHELRAELKASAAEEKAAGEAVSGVAPVFIGLPANGSEAPGYGPTPPPSLAEDEAESAAE